MKFKDLNIQQKRDLLLDEYLRDGAPPATAKELIPQDNKNVDARLRDVFSYSDDSEVE